MNDTYTSVSHLENVGSTKFKRVVQSYASNLFFCPLFCVSVDIFISTCRMTIIFLSTYSLMLGEYFLYLQRVLKVIFDDSRALWSAKICQKSRKVRNFWIVQNQFWSYSLPTFFTSKRLRVVKNHFQHTMKESDILSKHQRILQYLSIPKLVFKLKYLWSYDT